MTERQEIVLLKAITSAIERLPLTNGKRPAEGVVLLIDMQQAGPPPTPGAVRALAKAFRTKREAELRQICQVFGYKEIWMVPTEGTEPCQVWPAPWR